MSGKHVRKYGNRNKIVRIHNECFHAVVSQVARGAGVSYQEAFQMTMNFLTSREAFGTEIADRIVGLNLKGKFDVFDVVSSFQWDSDKKRVNRG